MKALLPEYMNSCLDDEFALGVFTLFGFELLFLAFLLI